MNESKFNKQKKGLKRPKKKKKERQIHTVASAYVGSILYTVSICAPDLTSHPVCVGEPSPSARPKPLDKEKCEEFGYEHGEAAASFPIALCLRLRLGGVRLLGCRLVGCLASCRLFPHTDDDIFVPAGLDVLPAFQHL